MNIMIYVIICLLVVLLLVYFIAVIILLRKYKSKCEKVNTIIKDEVYVFIYGLTGLDRSKASHVELHLQSTVDRYKVEVLQWRRSV